MTAAAPRPVAVPAAGSRAVAQHEELDRALGTLAQSQADLTAATELAGHLQEALATSRQIGMAIGVLMERHKLTPGQAFDQLREASSRGNVKLRDIADEILYTGESPGQVTSSRPLRDQ